MKQQFSHQLSSSFLQWFDHTLLKNGEAFTNYGSLFYEVKDPRLASYAVYSAPFGQIVSDTSIPGANIMSGVYINGILNPKSSTVKIDYMNGRVILPSTMRGATVSGNYAMKEFEIIFSPKSEDELLISSRFSTRPRFNAAPTGLADNEYHFPAVFISKVGSKNEAIEFGTTADYSITHWRALVMAEDDWQLDGIDSIFTAQKHRYFPLLDTTPFNEFGDLKTGSYNYDKLTSNATPDKLVFIKDASFTKFSSRANQAINSLVVMGVVEFTLEVRRI